LAQTSLRCSVSWPRRRTHCAHFVRSVQTTATSQMTTRAAREATSPALLGAPEARSSLPTRAFADTVFVLVKKPRGVASRQAAPGGGSVCGDEERRFEVGARSALRDQTCRSCLNEANAVSAVSSAARPRTEHRSAVDAQHRPPQPEPPPGAACRDTLHGGDHHRGRHHRGRLKLLQRRCFCNTTAMPLLMLSGRVFVTTLSNHWMNARTPASW